MILEIYMFIIAWILIFTLHELCHCIEALRQGADTAYIRLWSYHGIPSMEANAVGHNNKDLFNLAGGLYSGSIALSIGFIGLIKGISWIEIPFMICGILNVVYGIYEWLFIGLWSRDKYMVVHYGLYVAIIFPLLVYYLVR